MSDTKFISFLNRVQEATGINSQIDLATSLDIHRSAITQARKKDAIPDKWMVVLYRKFGLNPEWLETGQGPTFLKGTPGTEDYFLKVPKVTARLSAGGGSFENEATIEGYYSFRKDWLKSKGASDKMVMMDVVGNSMEPELKDGDTVLVNQAHKDILAGAVYAVGVDDTILIKRVEKLPNTLVLQSDNKNYSPIFLKGEEIKSVVIIGKVLWICREYR
ncbi:MAG: helix-turn-helix domain-containing protein [Proteobacteria bacterium]|nr:helix-turn-helix domain-containing protein [Pseudomonadota bacterium]